MFTAIETYSRTNWHPILLNYKDREKHVEKVSNNEITKNL